MKVWQRRGVQAGFLLLFIVFGVMPETLPGGDPLFRWDFVSVGTAAVASQTWLPALWFSAALVVITWLFGRVFCGWACPLGTLADILDGMLQLNTRGGTIPVY